MCEPARGGNISNEIGTKRRTKMKNNLRTLIIAAAAIISPALWANPFNKNLTDAERATLGSGKVLIKSISSVKKASVDRTPETEQVIDAMKKLGPTYIAEIIQVRPYEGNENLVENINAVLSDVSQYVGIPYYSERTGEWYELYSSAETTGKKVSGNKTTLSTILEMSVFGKFRSQIDIEKRDTNYFYMMKNLDKLRYHDKFNAVGKEKMQSVITVFRDGDKWILYAIGGADVLKIPFMSGINERVEVSFMNRIKTFCNYIFEKI